MTVLAAAQWINNAVLIEQAAKLGYLDGHVLDPTYGKGNWWTVFQPEKLTKHDLALDGVDFRDLPHPDGTFDAVAFDPPYVSPGGRESTGLPEFHERYGMADTPRTPRELFEYNSDGFAECARVVKPRGFIVYKSQDYITSGKFQPVTHWIIDHAFGFASYVDRFEHISGVRPQPPGRRQVHARRNLSTLLVFKR